MLTQSKNVLRRRGGNGASYHAEKPRKKCVTKCVNKVLLLNVLTFRDFLLFRFIVLISKLSCLFVRLCIVWTELNAM